MTTTKEAVTVRLTGRDAIAFAAQGKLPLSTYANEAEPEGRSDLSVAEAEAMVREDPRLIYIDTEATPALVYAIERGIAEGGDEADWDAPEFELARDLTDEIGCVWDFAGWKDTLADVREGKIGGVEIALHVF